MLNKYLKDSILKFAKLLGCRARQRLSLALALSLLLPSFYICLVRSEALLQQAPLPRKCFLSSALAGQSTVAAGSEGQGRIIGPAGAKQTTGCSLAPKGRFCVLRKDETIKVWVLLAMYSAGSSFSKMRTAYPLLSPSSPASWPALPSAGEAAVLLSSWICHLRTRSPFSMFVGTRFKSIAVSGKSRTRAEC